MTARAFNRLGMLAIAPSAIGQEFECATSAPSSFEEVNGVAIVTIEGPLTQIPTGWFDDYDAIARRCNDAFSSSCRAVMLEINSPGGDVAGLFDLATSLRQLATTTGKRFVAFTDGLAASAAYALASAAPEIYVSSTGQVGSIGVINMLADCTALDRAQGLRFSVIASGSRKLDGNPHVAITEDAEEEMRSKVNALAELFFDAVSTSRGMPVSQLKALDGAIHFGRGAVEMGLANAVTTKKSLLAMLASGEAATTTASAAATTETAMADDDKNKDDDKDYVKAMRAKLEQDAKSEDEGKAAAAKKMLKALGDDAKAEDEAEDEAEGDEADGGDDAKAKSRAKAEDDAKAEEDARAEGEDGKAKASAKVLAQLAKQDREIAALRARAEKSERAEIFSKRPDLTASTREYLASLPLADMKRALKAFPAPPPDPAASLKIEATRGAGETDSPRLPPAEAARMSQAMGLSTVMPKVERINNEVFFPALTPEQAREQAKSRSANGGAK